MSFIGKGLSSSEFVLMFLLKCTMVQVAGSFALLSLHIRQKRERDVPAGECNYITCQLVIIFRAAGLVFWTGMAGAQEHMLGSEVRGTNASRGANPA